MRALRFSRIRMIGALTAASAVALGVVGFSMVSAPAQAATLAEPDFYTPPPIPAGAKPGDVLRSRTFAYAPLNPFFGKGTGYQVLYVTTNVKGALIATSGIVIVPAKRAAGSPVVGVAHGTTGMGDNCAPSRALAGDADAAGTASGKVMQIFLDDTVNKGWVTAAPDYNGLGTPGSHTYSVGIEQGRATLDAVRAAQRLQAAAVPAGAKVAIMGYSQGGQSAAAAAEYQPTYAPELNLVGVAAGGVPADMVKLGEFNDGGPGFGFLMMAALGYDTAYPELGARALLNDKGKALIDTVDKACIDTLLTKYSGQKIADYTTTNPLTVPSIRAAFVANSLGKAAPKVPVMLYHALQDQYVPYDQDQALRRTWCGMGVKVQWQDFIGDHITVAVAGQPDAMTYVTNRLAGRTPTNNCPT